MKCSEILGFERLNICCIMYLENTIMFKALTMRFELLANSQNILF